MLAVFVPMLRKKEDIVIDTRKDERSEWEGMYVICYVVKRLWQYVLHYAMTVNYHGICTAHQSVHNSNPGVLATPAAIYKARS